MVRKLLTIAAAGTMALAPVAAQAAAPLSLAHSSEARAAAEWAMPATCGAATLPCSSA